MLRKLGVAADVQPCNPHCFRRTFALWSVRNGMNLYALQRMMGHSDIAILRRYLALVEADLQEAHARFGAVDNALR
jgi:integrase/recombinase XerD